MLADKPTAAPATAPATTPATTSSSRRLRRLTPDRLTGDQRALYATIADGPRASGHQFFALAADDGSLNGPFEALLLSPAIGTAVQELGAAVRYQSGLPNRLREMAILLVAAHWGSAFELMAHTALGRAAGLRDDDVDALLDRRTPPSADALEYAACAAVRALLTAGDLDDGAYADVVEHLGEQAVFELTTLVGYYGLLALQLRVFRVDG